MKQSGTAAHKLTIFYVGMLLLFLIGLWLFATIGKELETNVVDYRCLVVADHRYSYGGEARSVVFRENRPAHCNR